MSEIFERCREAADYITTQFDAQDAIGLILGSGLGELGDEIEDAEPVRALLDKLDQTSDASEKQAILGEALFQMTSLCRFLGIEAEEALSAHVERKIADAEAKA